MDSKITLSFDAAVIERAKDFAGANGLSLSRLTEILLRKATQKTYSNLEDMPISDWVREVSEGQAEYRTKARSGKDLKAEYHQAKKK